MVCARRQRRRDLGQLRLDAGHHALRVGAAQAEHQAFDRFALPLLVTAVAGEGADAHLGDVADAHAGRPLPATTMARTSSRLRIALRRAPAAIPRLVEAAGAVVAVVGLQRRLQLPERQAAGGKGGWSGTISKVRTSPPRLLTSATPGIGAQLRADHPVEQGALSASGRSPSMVNMNISPSGVVIGAMPPLAPGGRLPIAARQALADLLARPVDVGAVLEIDGDVGQRVLRGRAQQALVRDAEHFLLDRHGERVSTSSGVMPGAFRMILTWVVETSGKASIGRPRKACTPAPTSMTVSTSMSRRWVSEKRIRQPASFFTHAAEHGLEPRHAFDDAAVGDFDWHAGL
jgi:hypothetical protein